jgi:hypothetical protein
VQLCDAHELLLLVRQVQGGERREIAAVEEVVYQENMTTLSLNTHDAKNIKNLM